MTTNPFELPGTFWRGNIHTHSTRSDGVLDPEEVARRYKAEGYDFLAITDHFLERFDYPLTDVRSCEDEHFATILGAELHTGTMENGEIWHILAVGLPEDFTPANVSDFQPKEGQETGPEIAQRAREAGAFVAVAHPDWSQMTLADAASIEAAHAVEVYNHGCFAGCDRGYGFHIYERLLAAGRKLTLCATDDAHFSEPDHFGGWVMVKAETNASVDLLSALKDGAFYSSTGPEFHDVVWGKDQVEVSTSAVSTVILQGKSTRTVVRHGNSMTRTVLPFDNLAPSPWLRVTIIDAAGKRAWSNPIWRS
ncbi:MAG: CehA/McbA family metallohydrolase [Sulfitobacter sp.]